jgi:hypothetical protein
MSIQAQIWEQHLNGSFGAWIAWQAKEVNREVLPLFRGINWLLSWKFICWFCPCNCTTWLSLDQRKLFLERANKYLSCAPAFCSSCRSLIFFQFETFKWVDASIVAYGGFWSHHFCDLRQWADKSLLGGSLLVFIYSQETWSAVVVFIYSQETWSAVVSP